MLGIFVSWTVTILTGAVFMIFAIVIRTISPASSATARSFSAAATAFIERTTIRRVLTAFYFITFWTGDIGGFSHTFLTLDNVKEHFFAVANAAQVLVLVIFSDGGLMDEHVVVGVVAVDETVAVADVEPFYDASDAGD